MKVAFVCGGKAKVPAKPPSVNSPTDKIRVVDWENCFICKKKKIIQETSKLAQCYIC